MDSDTDKLIHHVIIKFKAPYYTIISVERKRYQWSVLLAMYEKKQFVAFS